VTTPPETGTGTVTAFAALPSPLDSVDDLRSAAKGMLAAAGGVGAVLISGGPLVAVGRVHGVAHAFIAGGALLLALSGVGLAIWQTSQVLIPPLTTPATLRKPSLKGLREVIESSPADFFGLVATSVDDLLRHQVLAVNLNRQLAREQDPRKHALMATQLRRVEANAERAAPYVRWLLGTAHVWQIQAELRRARLATMIGGVLVVAGAVGFFAVTGGGPTYVPVLTPQITAVPAVTQPPPAHPSSSAVPSPSAGAAG
jgi:hypothetical protein